MGFPHFCFYDFLQGTYIPTYVYLLTIFSHEKKKMYWAQLEMRCRYLYGQHGQQPFCSCCDECRYPAPTPHEMFPWDLMGNRYIFYFNIFYFLLCRYTKHVGTYKQAYLAIGKKSKLIFQLQKTYASLTSCHFRYPDAFSHLET